MKFSFPFTRHDAAFVAICWFAYSAAYVGRYNFNASILPMMDGLGWAKSEFGVIAGFFFFAYGIGQLVNGLASRFYDPKWMMAIGLLGSGVCNILLPLFPTPAAMRLVWCLNGCFQSILWCCVVKTFARQVSVPATPSAVVVISTTFATGTFLAYGLVALFAKTGRWALGFLVPGIMLLAAAATWIVVQIREGQGSSAAADDAPKAAPDRGSAFRIVFAFIAFACLAGVADGFLKDGLNVWVPLVLKDCFGIPSSHAILLVLGMTLLAILSAYANKKVHERVANHGTMLVLDFAGTTVLCGLLLVALSAKWLWLLVPAAAVAILLLVMVNNVLTSLMILDCRRWLDVGLVAGVIDTFCYVGTCLAAGGLGFVAEGRGGWNAVFWLFLLAAVAGTLVSLFARSFENKLLKL